VSDDSGAIPWDQLGWPKPANNPISKAQVRETHRQHNLPKLREVWDAQMSKALGVRHLVMRHEDGTFTRITDKPPEELDALLKSGAAVEIWLRDPDHKAIEDILNRCEDKPKEQEQEVIIHDGDRIRERLEAWKAAHRKGE
jgi:hypothetical protein